MKYKYLLLLLFTLLTATQSMAQRRLTKSGRASADTALIVKQYAESLALLKQQLEEVRRVNDSLHSESTDGRYYRLFAPTTFYHSGVKRQLSLDGEKGDEVAEAVDKAMLQLYMKRPDLVKNNETRLKKAGTLREDVNKEVKQKVDLTRKVELQPEEPEAVPIGLVVTKPNFWKFKGEGYLQFLQNYVSDNWHKGGESNYSAVGAVTLEMNYNDKDKITFSNKLEMKLGFQTSRSDTLHKFKANNDLLRLTSKLGLQASKKWYYTLQLLAYTQFARGLKSNDEFTYSDFMSPFDLNLGVGMEYKLKALNGKLTGSLNFSPLSFNFRYVARNTLLDRYKLGGHHTKEDFGSQFTGDVKWTITDQVTWKSRLYYYTSYHRGLMEWENQFRFQVSKYISANLFLYPRFDDSGKRDDKLGYFQFQEYCSLGLNYSF